MTRGIDDSYGNPGRGLPLFEDRPAGPFDQSTQKPTPEEIAVAAAIWKHKGQQAPISIARIHGLTSLNERAIKGVVEQLVLTHGIRIGARREDPSGYFIIETEEDLNAAIGPYFSQIRAMLRRLKALAPTRFRQLLIRLLEEI